MKLETLRRRCPVCSASWSGSLLHKRCDKCGYEKAVTVRIGAKVRSGAKAIRVIYLILGALIFIAASGMLIVADPKQRFGVSYLGLWIFVGIYVTALVSHCHDIIKEKGFLGFLKVVGESVGGGIVKLIEWIIHVILSG